MARLRVSSVAALLVVLLQSVNPAASQTDTPSPSNASNSSNSLPFYQEYNFTYPNSPSPQVLLVNYKDTINVSWTSVYPHHPPLLMLECWHRNITTSPLCTRSNPLITPAEPTDKPHRRVPCTRPPAYSAPASPPQYDELPSQPHRLRALQPVRPNLRRLQHQ